MLRRSRSTGIPSNSCWAVNNIDNKDPEKMESAVDSSNNGTGVLDAAVAIPKIAFSGKNISIKEWWKEAANVLVSHLVTSIYSLYSQRLL